MMDTLDRDGRRTLGLLALLLVVALAASQFFVWDIGRSTQGLLAAQEEAAASVLLAEGVPQTTVASAFAKDAAVTAEGTAFLEKTGHDGAGAPFLLAPLWTQMVRAGGVAFAGTLAVGGLALAIVGRLLRRQTRRDLAAADTVAAYAGGDLSGALPKNESGAQALLYGAVEDLARTLAAKSENEQRVKDFLKRMLSDISHQVKTPLAALRMYNEIILAEPENAGTVRDFAAKSEGALDKLEALIQALLRLTRLDAGSVTFARQAVALSVLVTQALAPLQTRAAREGKTLTLQGDPAEVLCCDAAWTEEAIANLVKNALDHTAPGGHVCVRWERDPAALRLTVADDGAGISPEDIHHIFKRFYRSTPHSAGGVGLGLPIAKAIIEGQGGALTVESAPGEGTRFTALFPTGEGAGTDLTIS